MMVTPAGYCPNPKMENDVSGLAGFIFPLVSSYSFSFTAKLE